MGDHRSSTFETTRWSLVARSGSRDAAIRARALGEIAASYWLPLYAYLRRSGTRPDDASDRVQGLFTKLIEGDGLRELDRDGPGRFRGWLLAALRNHGRDLARSEGTLRRAGGAGVRRISPAEAEARFAAAGLGDLAPEVAYDRAWAAEILRTARRSLRSEAIVEGRVDEFDRLADALLGDAAGDDRAALAASLRISPVALRVRLHRLRERLRVAVRAEVSRTYGDDVSPGEGLDELLRAAGGR